MIEKSIVPTQEKGSSLDVSAHIELDSLAAAISFFKVLKQRLLNVNQWDKLCAAPSSDFKLIDQENQEVNRLVKENDWIRIDIPGPGTQLGEGFDWVKVEQLKEQAGDVLELLAITVRPAKHPLKPMKGIAHFFRPDATSTFMVKRIGQNIYAEVHGRNELRNNKTGSFLDDVRNSIIAWSAKLGFSFPQWKLLVEGLVKK